MKQKLFFLFVFLPIILSIGLVPHGVNAASTDSSTLIKPTLSIDIPTVTFSDATIDGNTITINYLGDYIAGIYKWLLGSATLIAIVMLMIGGLQYTIFQEAKAKERIKNAVTGLALLLSTYLILSTVNPNLVVSKQLEIEVVQYVFLSTEDTASDVSALGLGTPPTTGTNNVPYYSQRNYTDPYGTSCDGGPTIKSSGCGPTSAAMVLNYYHVSLDPKQVAKAFESDGYRICGSGTSYDAFVSSSAIKNNNLEGQIIPINDHEKILTYLRNNEPIIVSVGNSRFTKSGHFIVLTGVNSDGTISINDPNSPINSATQDELWGIIKFAVYIHPKS
ncbi:C39 family peptidase [Candidatus Uhrbacteria bacterium]|nr:C39 family peptidase [Candidatus Uhrbacteria bacterium]